MAEIVRDDLGQPDDDGQSGADPSRDASARFGAPRRRGPLKAVREMAGPTTTFAYPVEQLEEIESERLDLEREIKDLRAQVADLDLRVREQLEIERMRDLELGRLEQELEQKSQRLAATEIELFHERRRSAELDRRWNMLNALFEDTAASLVETGATLHAISSQRSYRALVALVRMMRRNRRSDAELGTVAHRARTVQSD